MTKRLWFQLLKCEYFLSFFLYFSSMTGNCDGGILQTKQLIDRSRKQLVFSGVNNEFEVAAVV